MTREITVGVIKPEAIRHSRSIRSRLIAERLIPVERSARPWDMRTIETVYGGGRESIAVARAYDDAGLLGNRCEPLVLYGQDARRRLPDIVGPSSAREYGKDVHARTITGEFGSPAENDVTHEVDGKSYTISFNGFEALVDEEAARRSAQKFFPRPVFS